MHCFMAQQPLVGQGLLIFEVSRSHSDTPNSIGLLCTSDQPDTHTSTWQQTTFTKERHPCSQVNSNPQSQQASGCRHKLETAHTWQLYIQHCNFVCNSRKSVHLEPSISIRKKARSMYGQTTGCYLWVCEGDWKFSADISARSCIYITYIYKFMLYYFASTKY
jgi:hypothetical protein